MAALLHDDPTEITRRVREKGTPNMGKTLHWIMWTSTVLGGGLLVAALVAATGTVLFNNEQAAFFSHADVIANLGVGFITLAPVLFAILSSLESRETELARHNRDVLSFHRRRVAGRVTRFRTARQKVNEKFHNRMPPGGVGELTNRLSARMGDDPPLAEDKFAPLSHLDDEGEKLVDRIDELLRRPASIGPNELGALDGDVAAYLAKTRQVERDTEVNCATIGIMY